MNTANIYVVITNRTNIVPFIRDLAGESARNLTRKILTLYPLIEIPLSKIEFISSTNKPKYSFKSFGLPSPHQIAMTNGFMCGISLTFARIGQNSTRELLNNGNPSMLTFSSIDKWCVIFMKMLRISFSMPLYQRWPPAFLSIFRQRIEPT